MLAEKLFTLPITSYPELAEMEADMKALSTVYDLYQEHKVSRIMHSFWLIY